MSGDTEGDATLVPIECAECDTTTRVPLSKLADTLERHNESRHGGADVAEVDPAITEELADIVAKDMGFTS